MERSGMKSREAELAQVIRQFYKQQQQLHTIYSETRAAFAEVQQVGINAQSRFSVSSTDSYSSDSAAFPFRDVKGFAELSSSVVRKLDLLSNAKLCLFITGDSPIEKLALVNQLLGLQLMPVEQLRGRDDTFKLLNVRVTYSSRFSASLRLPDEPIDVFDLIDANQSSKLQPKQNVGQVTVAVDDVAVNATEQGNVKRGAVLEITVDSPLLRNGTQLLVSSSFLTDSVNETFERELLLDLHTLLELVHVVPNDNLAIYLHLTRACGAKAASRVRSHLQSIRSRHINAVPILVVHSALLDNHQPEPASSTSDPNASDDSIFDAAVANSLAEGGFMVLDEVDDLFDLARLPDASAIGEMSVVPLADSVEDLVDNVGKLNDVAQTQRCDVLLVDRLCISVLAGTHRKPSSASASSVDKDAEKRQVARCCVRAVTFGLRRLIVDSANLLYDAQRTALQHLILSAFDVARDLQVTPRRLAFVREHEQVLFDALMTLTCSKRDEIRALVADSICKTRQDLATLIAQASETETESATSVRNETVRIRELVLQHLSNSVATQLTHSVDVLRESFTGTLTRCMCSLELNSSTDAAHGEMSEQVHASSTSTATESLKRLLSSTYCFELSLQSSSTLVRALLARVHELLYSAPWNMPSHVDNVWRVSVAHEMLDALSAVRLARSVTLQMRDRLRDAHDTFTNALRALEVRHSDRLERAEATRDAVRIRFTPRIARLLLETASLRDVTLFGVPKAGVELGRGQYGVVHSCSPWAHRDTCAIKSVVPPDERHWNDLALEFFFSRHVGEHERLVTVYGCVVDYSYTGGGAAVLFVMERMLRDLHRALQTRLSWFTRLQIAVDVIEGLRYLHSQGLVHRDIKLKNVLLDKTNRAKLSDMGFCKPEVMMCGSIVGTPLHMAPELLSGKYDASVDVYAFGILFWFLCSGTEKLPGNFEQCTDRETLWDAVSCGLRPERLPHFANWCWDLMSSCWLQQASQRTLLGNVEPLLREKLDLERQSYQAGRIRRSASLSAAAFSDLSGPR